MNSRKKQFIAGAICPNCSEMDSLVLYSDDQSVECVSCDYQQTSQQRDIEAKQQQNSLKNNKPQDRVASSTKAKYKDASLIDITQIKE